MSGLCRKDIGFGMLVEFVYAVGQHFGQLHFQAGFTARGHFPVACPLDWLCPWAAL